MHHIPFMTLENLIDCASEKYLECSFPILLTIIVSTVKIAMSISFCLHHPVAVSVFLFVDACVHVLRCCACVCCM